MQNRKARGAAVPIVPSDINAVSGMLRSLVVDLLEGGSLGQFAVSEIDPLDVYDEEELLRWVKKNYPPDDIYETELDNWAERSGYRYDG